MKRLREEHDELIFLLRKGVDSENRENERRRQLRKMREMKDTASEEEVLLIFMHHFIAKGDDGTIHYLVARLRRGEKKNGEISPGPPQDVVVANERMIE